MNDKSNKFFKGILKDIVSFIETAFIALFVVTLVFTYVFHVATVNGESMKNTLMPDDRLITTVWYNSAKQGDIVIIYAADSVTLNDDGSLDVGKGLRKTLVKRVVAVEGQTVDID
ncbi:MAG: signal peptidase I, partial [Ruminococcus sp.]|nr:signal peptidase I [Ruminococcus sp.]